MTGRAFRPLLGAQVVVTHHADGSALATGYLRAVHDRALLLSCTETGPIDAVIDIDCVGMVQRRPERPAVVSGGKVLEIGPASRA